MATAKLKDLHKAALKAMKDSNDQPEYKILRDKAKLALDKYFTAVDSAISTKIQGH